MYSIIHTIFNAKEIKRVAERIQRLEYKYESADYVEYLIKSGKL